MTEPSEINEELGIIGWRIIDEYGEIVATGPVTVAEMTSDTEQLLNTEE